jgi:hypothetical protein
MMPSAHADSEAIPVVQLFPTYIEGQPLAGKKILIIVENLPLPFDRRVWQEARTLKAAGAEVSIICPKGKGYDARYELLDGVHIVLGNVVGVENIFHARDRCGPGMQPA